MAYSELQLPYKKKVTSNDSVTLLSQVKLIKVGLWKHRNELCYMMNCNSLQ